MALPRIENGDVFKIKLTTGYGLIQCVKKSTSTECEIIRVLRGVHQDINDRLVSAVIGSLELFFALIPLKYALKSKMILYVTNHPIPVVSEAPKYFRDKHIIRSDFLGWDIVDSETLQRKLVQDLTKEEQELSPWGIFSIPDLVERIEESWVPANWK